MKIIFNNIIIQLIIYKIEVRISNDSRILIKNKHNYGIDHKIFYFIIDEEEKITHLPRYSVY